MELTAKLPTRVETSSAQALHAEWLGHVIEARQEIVLDCSAVEVLGAAAAQLIVSLSKTLKTAGLNLKLHNISKAMNDDLATLGLQEYLRGMVSHG
jgi:anti-anti-sigma regulatory factor